MAAKIEIHHITKVEILKEVVVNEYLGRYNVLTLSLADVNNEAFNITVFGATNKHIEYTEKVKELPVEQQNPIDYLEDGCVVATVSNKYYIYIKALKTFIGLEDSFYLHNIADDLSSELDYSIKIVYKPGTVKALAPTETVSGKGIIAWARDTV